MNIRYLIRTIFIYSFIGLFFSCQNSVSYKTGKLNPDREKLVRMLIDIDKENNTLIHSLKDSNRKSGIGSMLDNPQASSVVKSDLNTFFKEDNNSIVKDPKTAADIAYIYFKNAFGEKTINDELPLNVYLIDNHWFIEGSFNTEISGYFWARFGGVSEILISKTDGRLIHLTHGK